MWKEAQTVIKKIAAGHSLTRTIRIYIILSIWFDV